MLRHGQRYEGGKSKWTQAYWRWLERIKFGHRVQQTVFQEYIDSVKQQQQRVADLEQAMHEALADWTLAPVVEGLMALRGCRLITAMTVVAELGDITRFDSPRQLMSYLGLVPRPVSHRVVRRHAAGGLRRQAMAMSDECWWRLRGAIGFQPAKQQSYSGELNKPPKRYKQSRGRHRNGSVVDIRL